MKIKYFRHSGTCLYANMHHKCPAALNKMAKLRNALNIFLKHAKTRVERTQGVFKNTSNLEHQVNCSSKTFKNDYFILCPLIRFTFWRDSFKGSPKLPQGPPRALPGRPKALPRNSQAPTTCENVCGANTLGLWGLLIRKFAPKMTRSLKQNGKPQVFLYFPFDMQACSKYS